MFEAKTIRRMELLVLTHLKWKMQAFTPCSFIDYFLSKVNDHKYPSRSLISGSIQLIMNTIKGESLCVYKYMICFVPYFAVKDLKWFFLVLGGDN